VSEKKSDVAEAWKRLVESAQPIVDDGCGWRASVECVMLDGVPDQVTVLDLSSGLTHRFVPDSTTHNLAEENRRLTSQVQMLRANLDVTNSWSSMCQKQRDSFFHEKKQLEAQVSERDTAVDNAAKRIKCLEQQIVNQGETIATYMAKSERDSREIQALKAYPWRTGVDFGVCRSICVIDKDGYPQCFPEPKQITVTY
jgi:hypothetical protein